MALVLAIILFLTIALVVFSFGAAAYAPFSVLGSRLRALGWQRTEGLDGIGLGHSSNEPGAKPALQASKPRRDRLL